VKGYSLSSFFAKFKFVLREHDRHKFGQNKKGGIGKSP
jgi:hypothetical protein